MTLNNSFVKRDFWCNFKRGMNDSQLKIIFKPFYDQYCGKYCCFFKLKRCFLFCRNEQIDLKRWWWISFIHLWSQIKLSRVQLRFEHATKIQSDCEGKIKGDIDWKLIALAFDRDPWKLYPMFLSRQIDINSHQW